MSERRAPDRFLNATLGLALFTLGARVLGFFEKQVLAYYFGADASVDAFFVALSLPVAIFIIVRELLEPAFLPLFVEKLSQNREIHGWKLFSLCGLGTLLVLGLTTATTFMFADGIVSLLAPGFDEQSKAITAKLLQIMIPGSVFLGLSGLTYVTLNGYRRFFLPAGGDLFYKAMPSVCCIALYPSLGIASLSIGFLIGCFCRLAVHLIGLTSKLKWIVWPSRENREDYRRLRMLMLPLLLGTAFSQVSMLADNSFASTVGEGGVAALNYARKIADLPILLVPYTMSVVLFPMFSDLVARKRRDKVFELLGKYSHGLALLFVPISICIIILAEPIISLLFQRGAFDESANRLTAAPLAVYAIGMSTFALEAILVPFYYALQNTRTPVFVGIFAVLVNMALAAILVKPLSVSGIALALVLSKTIKLIILTVRLRKHNQQVRWSSILSIGLRLVGTSAIPAIALMGCHHLVYPLMKHGILNQALYIALAGGIGMGLFFATAALIGASERTMIILGLKAACRLIRIRTKTRK